MDWLELVSIQVINISCDNVQCSCKNMLEMPAAAYSKLTFSCMIGW
jgi:hypothetical protein